MAGDSGIMYHSLEGKKGKSAYSCFPAKNKEIK